MILTNVTNDVRNYEIEEASVLNQTYLPVKLVDWWISIKKEKHSTFLICSVVSLSNDHGKPLRAGKTTS